MDLMLRRFALLSLWLTVVAIAADGAVAPAAQQHAIPGQSPVAANQPNGTKACELCQFQSAGRDSCSGEQLAERGEARMLLALSPSVRLLKGPRPKAAGSPILDKPQADRHVLLALVRSAATSSTACLPLLRSTQLRI